MDDSRLGELARRALEGDRDCFRFLVESESRRLIAVAYRYTRDWEAARDLCQETWIKVHGRLSSYDPARSFRSWLGAIHRNHCVSYLRKPAVSREQTTSPETLRQIEPAVEERDPLARLQSDEFATRLRAAMRRLSERQLRVFTLVDLEEGSHEQASRILGMKPATLRATLHFARKKLAKGLRGMENEPCARS